MDAEKQMKIARNSSGRVWPMLLVFLIGILAGGVIVGEVVRTQSREKTDPGKPDSTDEVGAQMRQASAMPDVPAEADPRATPVVSATRKVVSSVVSISVTQIRVARDPFFDEFFGGFFVPEFRNRFQEVNYIGSGVLFDTLGHILTNNHVVDGASRIMINLPDGREFKGELLGTDPLSDLAVIRIAGPGLPYVGLGNSESLMLGETVIAIGNPFGYLVGDANPSVTCGIVSALHRNFRPNPENQEMIYRNMIQTDATINPGNSGGPLVNVLGEVIGINAFIVSPIKGSVGLGFAIPINKARKVAKELIQYGKRRRYKTGLKIQDLDPRLSAGLGLSRETRGVVATQVERGSPSEKAGIRIGDAITSVNGESIHSSEDVQLAFSEFFAGDKVYLEIVRSQKRMKVALVLEIESAGPDRR